MTFEKNVFINCPFDKAYKPILDALVFCLVYLDYDPLLSENLNSANARIDQILTLIKKSKYSVHDLSRMESTSAKELARFNMPFELGLDMGCKYFGENHSKEKCILILDKEKYRYQKSLSDLSGNDISSHSNEPEMAIRALRNWFIKISGNKLDSANKIWRLYNEFLGDFYDITLHNELSKEDIEEMPLDEYCSYIKEWLAGRKEFRE